MARKGGSREPKSRPKAESEPNAPLSVRGGPYQFRGRPLVVSRGYPLPLGASRQGEGVNFVVISRYATAVWLVLSEPCGTEILTEIALDPDLCRTGHHWHISVVGLPDEFCYGYRVDGPKGGGHRYDPSTVLLDPASRALSCGQPWGVEERLPRRSLPTPSMATGQDEDAPRHPRTPRADSILYELHVRGYTIDPSSGVRQSGTYAGLVEKIPYLKALGITAVELLPIDEFDELDCPFFNPLTGERLKNFWGYSTIAYAAPKAAYAVHTEGIAAWEEFRHMVRAFHEAGIEVILDVVFNHTAEGNEQGTTYSFRGLDNSLYYLLDEQGRYLNFTGCGNTLNSNQANVRQFVRTCLQSFVAEAGIDGFRFDLASVLGRDSKGQVMLEPPVVESLSDDALLGETKLIAEPWDAAGLYQVADFPGGARWSVWNGRYRDDVRRFWRGDPDMTSSLATRICGSDDLFSTRGPLHSINFLTCHDGFTLYDLVSYNAKNNVANGEGNLDGINENFSWNCGAEGPTTTTEVLDLRRRQARNLIATLLISQGVPMLLGGDEFLRSQGGNNNAWCQDNATSWVNWALTEDNADFLRFVRELIALRRRHPILRRTTFLRGRHNGQPPDIVWHGIEPGRPDFSFDSHALAFALDGRGCDRPGVVDRDLYVVLNAYWEPLTFQVPAAPSGRRWRRTVDTAAPPPEDVLALDQGPVIPILLPYQVEARSMIILTSESR